MDTWLPNGYTFSAHEGGSVMDTVFRQLHIARKFVVFPYSSKSAQCASEVRHILD